MAQSTPTSSQTARAEEDSHFSSTGIDASTTTIGEAVLENVIGDSAEAETPTSMSIETTANCNEDLPTSSLLQTSTETTVASTPTNDKFDSSPRALENLVLAAASDLLEVSPRSAMEMETPTSQAGTPYNKRNIDKNGKTATPSTTPEQPKAEDNKPKGILKKKLRYSSTVPIVIDSTSGISPTSGNTIHNLNQFRKNRGRNDFDFDSSDIDRLVDNDDDDFYNSENSGSTTLLSILWSVVVMPVVLLGYGGLPYLVLASLVWTLIFVARWFRRFLVEEFSMRRNGSLNEEVRKASIPSSEQSPFLTKASSNSKLNRNANLSGILSAISPVAGARKTKVRFPAGIKFPERKLLRQPIPRIQKPNHQKTNTRNRHKKPSSPFFVEEENCDGDSWSLDSLMVLRNYMKDTDYNNNSSNNNNGLDPTPMSVLGPPPPYPYTLSEEETSLIKEDETTTMISASSEIETSSGDEADDEFANSVSSLEDDPSENDEVPELMSSLAGDTRRRDSVMFFPQEYVEEEDTAYELRYGHSCSTQPTIQLDDDMDDEPIDDYFHEGLFGKADSSSPTTISDSMLRKKASRYRRRKPRDSLCFTFAKKSVVPECPTLPQCPSDELEFLEQKKQEKFEQAVVIEHYQEQSSSVTDEEPSNGKKGVEPCENRACSEDQFQDEHDAAASTSSLTAGSWDENEESFDNSKAAPLGLFLNQNVENDENMLESDADEGTTDVEKYQDASQIHLDSDAETEMPSIGNVSDFDEKVNCVLKDVEELLASHKKSLSPRFGVVSDAIVNEPGNDEAQYIKEEESSLVAEDVSESNGDGWHNSESVEDILLEEKLDSMASMTDGETVSDEEEASMMDDLPIVNDLNDSLEDESPWLTSHVDVLSLGEEALTQESEVEEPMGTEDKPQVFEQRESETTGDHFFMDENEQGLANLEDSSLDKVQYSTIIDEALQESDSKELVVLEESMRSSDDDFPEFNVMQEISFDDESDEVECILSPHAFQCLDEEPMFRDRDPMMHLSIAGFNKSTFKESDEEIRNDPTGSEILTKLSDLQIEVAVTDDDVECTLSPIAFVEADAIPSDDDNYGEVELSAPSYPKSPENKENVDKEEVFAGTKKGKFYVDTTSAPTKALDDMNLPWSPAFPRAVLSPTNQRPTRS